MDIYWHGQACFKLKGKNATVIIDPFNPEAVGLKLPKDLEGDVVLITHEHQDHNNPSAVAKDPMIFAGPGEYEVKGVVITGINSWHDDTQGAQRGKNIIYHINIDGLNIVHLGDFGQEKLTQEQLQEIGQVDILLTPVGGIYTIDGKQAVNIVSQLEPRIIVPMHYLVPNLKFDLEPVDKFLKEMGSENSEPQSKLTVTTGKLPEEPQVVVLKTS